MKERLHLMGAIYEWLRNRKRERFLFRMVMDANKPMRERLSALTQIDSQKYLYKIAMKCKNYLLQSEAVNRLNDWKKLDKIANCCRRDCVRSAARIKIKRRDMEDFWNM